YGDHATAVSWDPYLILLAIGGTLLTISIILIVYIVFYLMFWAPKGKTEFPVADGGKYASLTPKWTERWGLWIFLMIIVVSLGYVIPLIDMIQHAPPGSPPFVTW